MNCYNHAMRATEEHPGGGSARGKASAIAGWRLSESDGQPMADNTGQFQGIVTITENLDALLTDVSRKCKRPLPPAVGAGAAAC